VKNGISAIPIPKRADSIQAGLPGSRGGSQEMDHETQGLGYDILSIDDLFRRLYGKTCLNGKDAFTQKIRQTPTKQKYLDKLFNVIYIQAGSRVKIKNIMQHIKY